jgi:hypothetical protein
MMPSSGSNHRRSTKISGIRAAAQASPLQNPNKNTVFATEMEKSPAARPNPVGCTTTKDAATNAVGALSNRYRGICGLQGKNSQQIRSPANANETATTPGLRPSRR